MNSFYIYSYKYMDKVDGTFADVSATVIFCSCDDIDEADLISEIKIFYQNHYQTDKVFAIASNLNVSRFKEVFIDHQNETFKGIPKRQETALNENLYLISFDKNGNLKCENDKKIPQAFLKTYQNEGLQNIFTSRGGLIVSEDSHHYVFPSGKHCDRFLRTGNILLYSPEIFFIAFCLLKHFNEEIFTRIYCDTSSINSIAFALFDLKNNFLPQKIKVSIESFSSYDGLYKYSESYTKDSLLLISASTSSNIIKYILDRQSVIDRQNVIILYFLGEQKDYSNVKDQVLCNLTQSDANANGIPFYRTYQEKDCEFCKKGSYAVLVSGDVFLLEKPQINKIQLATTDREKGLSNFVQQFKSVKRTESVFKVHYKENSEYKYEVYIDFVQILKKINENPGYPNYKKRLDDFIEQYVPSKTQYILFLNDQGSEELANYIFDSICSSYKEEVKPILLKQHNLLDIDPKKAGAIVIAGSCISSGKNLLYISRALRKFDLLKVVYFIGIVRTLNNNHLINLKKNLTRGRYGADTNSFVTVETMFCSNCSKNSPWLEEIDFLKEICLFIQTNHADYKTSLKYFEDRKQLLLNKSGDTERGMTEDLFYKRITGQSNEPLVLRKNFAFWDFDKYDEDVTQADVYFTISNIINSLRNSDKVRKQLKQAAYVRNLLDPGNFNRFNDGIIQSSILRSARADELSYNIDPDVSQEMYNILETIITYHEQEQGEALSEFLYAIAIKKLSITPTHLKSILEKIEQHCTNELFMCFKLYIEKKLILDPESLKSTPLSPLGAPIDSNPSTTSFILESQSKHKDN